MKVPPTPSGISFTVLKGEIVSFHHPLWRIHKTGGPHASRWNELRHFGPVPGMRFEPHPEPEQHHAATGVAYAAVAPASAFAEAFQVTRVIDRYAYSPALVSWIPSRPLSLLDLTGLWPIRNGAAAALSMQEDKDATSSWAREIYRQLGNDIDGLVHTSSLTHQPLVTLFSRVERDPAFPARPSFNAPLSSVTTDEIVDFVADQLNYGVI